MARGHFTRRYRELTRLAVEWLDRPNAVERVTAVRTLISGVTVLEDEILRDARQHGMSWEAIGRVYGITRQGAQQRFGRNAVLDQLETAQGLAALADTIRRPET